jgi:rod shape-determining protein MreD
MSRPARTLLGFALCVVALALEVSALSLLPLPWATPDLMLVVVVALALCYGEFYGMVYGFCVGIAFDIVPPAADPIGSSAFVLCLVGYLAGAFRRPAQRTVVQPLMLVGALSCLSVLLHIGIAMLVGDHTPLGSSWWHVLLGAAGYDMFLSPFVVPAVLALARRVDRRRLDPNSLNATRLGDRRTEADDSLLVR